MSEAPAEAPRPGFALLLSTLAGTAGPVAARSEGTASAKQGLGQPVRSGGQEGQGRHRGQGGRARGDQ